MWKLNIKPFLVCLFALSLCVTLPSRGDEDEISVDTLPDELPIEMPSPSSLENIPSKRSPQSLSTSENKRVLEDLELEKATPPLFPTEPLLVNESNNLISAKQDSELSEPDPTYVPPEKITIPKGIERLPSHKEDKAAKNRLQRPNLSAAPTQGEVSVDQYQPQTSLMVMKPTHPLPPFVLAPEIFAKRMEENTGMIPVGTFNYKFAVPPTTPSRPPKGVSDISIILSNNEFYPAKVVLKSGESVRLLFTTTNRKPAALVIEKLNIQRWVSSQVEGETKKELDRSKFELNRELSSRRVTDVNFDPKPGVYSFHDVITGASGEISVEEP
ncbi:MAG: hypothetical protein EXR74_03540 [Bdellovibrionales bacterium]|nr:hypothetical protein [Bdellovibrionales bacterium]